MKRTLLATIVLLILVACASLWHRPSPVILPGVVTLEAQALPITRTVAWDANAPADAVTGYVVRLDGVVIGSPTGTQQAFTITALGPHVLSVVAINLWAESAPSTLAINVVAPAQPAGLRIQ